METKSPASTNGAFLLTDAQSQEQVTILVPSNVNLTGYTSEDKNVRFEKIELTWEKSANRLTHPSATAGYAVFRTDCIGMGIPPVSFATWLNSATQAVHKELTQESHHLHEAEAS